MSSVDESSVSSTSGTSPTTAHVQAFSRLCAFVVAGKPYAVDLGHTRGVVPVESITPIPGMPPVLMGVMNVHSSVVPVLDLRLLLGLPQTDALAPFAVVLRHDEYQMAVLVDRSPEIIAALPEEFLPAPASEYASEAADAVVLAGLKANDQITSILDVPRLVDYVESEETARDVP
jgi:purine-binding chemotaxis protein CheW